MTGVDDVTGLLRRRTAVLARPIVEPDDIGTSDVLVVTVVGRTLGLDGRYVSQVRPGSSLCRLPHGSGALTALVPVGNGAVPVADLGRLLGEGVDTTRAYVVLLEGDTPPVGLLVDAVHEVRTVAAQDVRPVPDAREGALEAGIAPDGLVLLDLPRLLADPRLHPRSTSPEVTASSHPQESHVQVDHR